MSEDLRAPSIDFGPVIPIMAVTKQPIPRENNSPVTV